MSTPMETLEQALAGEVNLLEVLEARGWSEVEFPVELTRARLRDVKLLAPGEHENAPRILLFWREKFGRRAVFGKELRSLQAEANQLRNTLKTHGFTTSAPDMAIVGCSAFLSVFPLNGNPHARRVRLTTAILEKSSQLVALWERFDAAELATWLKSRKGGRFAWRQKLKTTSRQYDWGSLYVGHALDQEFVAFMGITRQHIAQLLLDEDQREDLLEPILEVLRRHWDRPGVELKDASELTLRMIARSVGLRGSLIATIDTVLLRLVLYRYLDAQFDYQQNDSETRSIAFGSYDELLDRTTTHEDERFEQILENARKAYGLQVRGKKSTKSEELPTGQLDLFPNAVHLIDARRFREEERDQKKRRRQDAGGDLHQDEIARAADILQDYLLERRSEEFAALLEGTRSNRFSFHYADLDPRAFQQFYEDTIGTDIRLRYEPESNRIRVSVEEWSKNQKEQGAYYTDEKMAGWLAQRTLGERIAAWLEELYEFLRTDGKRPKGRLPWLREHLSRLMGLRVIDFACGGGIFLRAAFELLSEVREKVVAALKANLPEKDYNTLRDEEPYGMFHPSAESGQWEWYILLHCIHGVDRDIKALNVASNLLTLSALTYKPYGVSFPSFVNVNLKVGNAFVIPLDPEQRANLAQAYKEEIRKLIELRAQMRRPELPRETWRNLHIQATEITRKIVDAQIIVTFRDVFGEGISEADLIERVRQVGCFLYEIEFPEVFFDVHGEWRSDAGFDVVLGNPPWEEPAAEYKHFLPEFDAEYQSLKGRASKQREAELLTDPEIARRWDLFQDSIQDYRTLLEATEVYAHQNVSIKGKKTGAHSNLYKYAVELGYHLTRGPHGAVGMVIDGGLWSDRSATGLRRLLLDHTRVEAICGFINNKGIFPGVHRSYKFSCTIFSHDETDQTFPAVFMRRDIEDLDNFEALAAELSVQEIRADRSETYPVPEIRNQAHANACFAIAHHPRLNDDTWDIDTYSRELNEGEQRHFFIPVEEAESRTVPLIKGAQFNLWGVHQGALPEYHVSLDDDAAGGFLRDRQLKRILEWLADALRAQGLVSKRGSKKSVAEEWLKETTGSTDLPEEWLRLDLDGYRIAWRDISNATNKRTLITGIIPPGVALTAPFVRPFRLTVEDDSIVWEHQYPPMQLLYLCGVLSSFPCDAIVRGRVAKTNVSSSTFKRTEVPEWTGAPNQKRIATLCARLTCLPATTERPWADYTELAAEVGLDPDKDGLVEHDERYEAEVELNARAALEYEPDPEAFAFLMELLFMTPSHATEHRQLKQDIVAYMKTL